jgi:hypothetical protein
VAPDTVAPRGVALTHLWQLLPPLVSPVKAPPVSTSLLGRTASLLYVLISPRVIRLGRAGGRGAEQAVVLAFPVKREIFGGSPTMGYQD